MSTGFLNYQADIKALILVGGHPFDRNGFAEMFGDMENVSATFVDHPAAAEFYHPDTADNYDVLVLFDVPGVDLYQALQQQKPELYHPQPHQIAGFEEMLRRGIGVLAIHHSISGWPLWDDYAKSLGGRFQYLSGPLCNRETLDSGYRAQVEYDVQLLPHAITDGLPETFSLTDELYLYEVFEEDVIPLATARYDFTRDNFYSAEAVLRRGEFEHNTGWNHEPGSNLIAWAKTSGCSPVVYIQPGDDATTYTNKNYRALVERALHWLASDEASHWASIDTQHKEIPAHGKN